MSNVVRDSPKYTTSITIEHMKLSIVLILFIVSFSAFGQQIDTPRQVLDKILTHAKDASLYREKVNWDSLSKAVLALSSNAKNVTDLGPSLKFLLKSLGDEHGRVFHNNQIIAYYYGAQKDHQKSFDPQIYEQVQSGVSYQFETRLLNDHIGYVRIVGLPMGDNQQMAKLIQDKVCELVSKGAKQWILDLRYNGGGNMHPMAEGITQLIGNGYVGGSQGLTAQENSSWNVKNGDFYYDGYSVQLKNDCQVKSLPAVAVLTSVYTASSGEAIAVIFKGRDKTRFFGEKTLGMITVTDWEVLNDATAMTISVSYYKDRKGKVYKNFVDVDEPITFVKKPLSEDDICVQKAISWLKTQ